MIDSPDAIFYLYKVKSSNHNRLLLSFSERAGIRTPDNLIKSQVLYHLSYTPVSFYSLFANKNAQNRNRTSDTRIFSPLLYQLSYLGIRCIATTSNILLYKVNFVNTKCIKKSKKIQNSYSPYSAIHSATVENISLFRL